MEVIEVAVRAKECSFRARASPLARPQNGFEDLFDRRFNLLTTTDLGWSIEDVRTEGEGN